MRKLEKAWKSGIKEGKKSDSFLSVDYFKINQVLVAKP